MATAKATAIQLAMFLGPEWLNVPLADEEPETVAELVNPLGATLRIYSDRYGVKGKIEIHGCSPPNDCGLHITDRKGITTSISVSATKDPAKIARDIRSRLLPEYLKAYNDLLERITAIKRQDSAALVVARRLN